MFYTQYLILHYIKILDFFFLFGIYCTRRLFRGGEVAYFFNVDMFLIENLRDACARLKTENAECARHNIDVIWT